MPAGFSVDPIKKTLEAFLTAAVKAVDGHPAADRWLIAQQCHGNVQVRAVGVEQVQLVVHGFLDVDGVAK
ncbi:hypothetical protein [Pseudomonas grimontii]|uniref:hypothetical protein n=1 Tax=Pseudomonas grimontii TaxID=129847 RepID=UPI00387B1228